LLIPVAIYGLVVGLVIESRPWLWSAVGVAIYVGAQQLGAALAADPRADPSCLLAIPSGALCASFGQGIARQRRSARAFNRAAARLLFPERGAGVGDVRGALPGAAELHSDDSALTEGGLVRSIIAEDREAAMRSRLWGYVISAALIALYIASGAAFLLIAAGGVFFFTVLGLVLSAVTASPSTFDLLTTGYFELASVGFMTVLRRHPLDVKAHIGLGLALLHRREFDRATQEFDLARRVDIHRFSIGVWLGIERMVGLAAQERGDHDQAARAFGSVLALFPDHAPTLYHMGLSQRGRGRHEAARRCLERSAELGHEDSARDLQAISSGADRGRIDRT